jgi:hypothetical protein
MAVSVRAHIEIDSMIISDIEESAWNEGSFQSKDSLDNGGGVWLTRPLNTGIDEF